MKPILIAGIVLIVLGLAALAYQGITYTTRETVIDIGPFHATAEREKTIPLPPILGILAIGGGVALSSLRRCASARNWHRSSAELMRCALTACDGIPPRYTARRGAEKKTAFRRAGLSRVGRARETRRHLRAQGRHLLAG